MKSLVFDESVRVVLIPSRCEYRRMGLNSSLWWSPPEYTQFQIQAHHEIKKFAHEEGINFKDARKHLYQSVAYSIDDFDETLYNKRAVSSSLKVSHSHKKSILINRDDLIHFPIQQTIYNDNGESTRLNFEVFANSPEHVVACKYNHDTNNNNNDREFIFTKVKEGDSMYNIKRQKQCSCSHGFKLEQFEYHDMKLKSEHILSDRYWKSKIAEIHVCCTTCNYLIETFENNLRKLPEPFTPTAAIKRVVFDETSQISKMWHNILTNIPLQIPRPLRKDRYCERGKESVLGSAPFVVGNNNGSGRVWHLIGCIVVLVSLLTVMIDLL